MNMPERIWAWTFVKDGDLRATWFDEDPEAWETTPYTRSDTIERDYISRAEANEGLKVWKDNFYDEKKQHQETEAQLERVREVCEKTNRREIEPYDAIQEILSIAGEGD